MIQGSLTQNVRRYFHLVPEIDSRGIKTYIKTSNQFPKWSGNLLAHTLNSVRVKRGARTKEIHIKVGGNAAPYAQELEEGKIYKKYARHSAWVIRGRTTPFFHPRTKKHMYFIELAIINRIIDYYVDNYDVVSTKISGIIGR